MSGAWSLNPYSAFDSPNSEGLSHAVDPVQLMEIEVKLWSFLLFLAIIQIFRSFVEPNESEVRNVLCKEERARLTFSGFGSFYLENTLFNRPKPMEVKRPQKRNSTDEVI